MSISRMDKIIKMCFALILCLIFVANVSGISVSATKNTIQIKRSISGWSVPANSVKKVVQKCTYILETLFILILHIRQHP